MYGPRHSVESAQAAAKPSRATQGLAQQHAAPSPEHALQRALGNQFIQAKLTIGPPDDPYEREADHVADEVLGMAEPGSAAAPLTPPPDPPLQRKGEDSEKEPLQRKPLITPLVQRQRNEEEDEALQARSNTGRPLSPPPDFGTRLDAMRGNGQPLTSAQRGFFDSRFGHDFNGVRLHTGNQAAEAAGAIKARAFTSGNDVAFGAGEYAPHTLDGQRLLAHELTHVVQQTAPTVYTAPTVQRQVDGLTPVEAENAETIATPGLIVEDEAVDFAPGRMGKTAFLTVLQDAVCSTAETILEAVGRSTEGCPYLDFWFTYYAGRSSTHIEQAIHRYAPEAAAGITAARDYIPLIVARVRLGVERWALHGELSGIPEDVPLDLPASSTAQGGTTGSSGAVQFKANEGGARNASSPAALRAQLGEGRAFGGTVRTQMESAFGTTFSDVRLHTEATAATLADRHNARAFTVGDHVAFGVGEYQPSTPVGQALLAHELAHVIQQRGASTSDVRHKGDDAYDTLEADADRSAVGAVVSLWQGAKKGLADVAENAMPRLKSGLRLQRCGGDTQNLEDLFLGTVPTTVSGAADRIVELLDMTTSDKEEQEILAILASMEPNDYEELIRDLAARRDGAESYLQRLYDDMHGAEFQNYLQINRAKLIAARAGNPEDLEATMAALERGEGISEEIQYDPARWTAPSTWTERSILYEGRYDEEGNVSATERVYSGFLDVTGKTRRAQMGPTELGILDESPGGGQRIITAADLLATADSHESEHFWNNVNIVGILLGAGLAAGARTMLGRAAIITFEVVIPAAGQYIADHRSEIAAMDGGEDFLRAWQIFDIAMAGFGIAQLARGAGRSVVGRLRSSTDDLIDANPTSPIAREVAQHIEEVSEGFGMGSVRGRYVYSTPAHLNQTDLNSAVEALAGRGSRLHGSTLTPVSGNRFTLSVTEAGSTRVIDVDIEVHAVERADWDRLPSVHGAEGGPANMTLSQVGGTWVARIDVHEGLHADDILFVLGHELDEMADLIRRNPRASGAEIAQETGASLYRRGGTSTDVTAHDRAAGRELAALYEDLQDAQRTLASSPSNKKNQLAVTDRQARLENMMFAMGLHEGNRAQKISVLREMGVPEDLLLQIDRGIETSINPRRFDTMRQQLSESDIEGSRPTLEAVRSGHARGSHRVVPAQQAEIMNDPERIFSGINDNGRTRGYILQRRYGCHYRSGQQTAGDYGPIPRHQIGGPTAHAMPGRNTMRRSTYRRAHLLSFILTRTALMIARASRRNSAGRPRVGNRAAPCLSSPFA